MLSTAKRKRRVRGSLLQQIAPGVTYLTTVFVNAYMVGSPGGPWVLVDTGLRGFADRIRRAAEGRYGRGTRPEAIILTHGHFDHAGTVTQLAEKWDVPVYAHPLEMPFLTGRDLYPPPDPTVGGFLAFLSRFFPDSGIDLGGRVRELPADGSVPGMPGWRSIHTPGHTTGHTSFFREQDRVLLAGDALATLNQESALATFTNKQSINGPPSPVTGDWRAARQSVRDLAALRPAVLACGHGAPMTTADVAEGLAIFARNFDRLAVPDDGRYVRAPALTNETGIVRLPPPASDPLPKVLAGVALAALAGTAFVLSARESRRRSRLTASEDSASEDASSSSPPPPLLLSSAQHHPSPQQKLEATNDSGRRADDRTAV